jgi:GNAT superfamily N-acetyltransferase
MPVTVRSLLVEDLADHLDAVERVYALAFDEDAATSRRFRNRLATEARSMPGFQFNLASEQDEAVGFIYGYQLQLSDWWAHLIRPAMAEANVAYWLDDAFELVEFAVVPNRQGRGIGAALYDALFANVTEPRALLGTDPPPTPAYRFYARRGWQVLLPDWRHSPDDADSLIVMGLDRQTLQTG